MLLVTYHKTKQTHGPSDRAKFGELEFPEEFRIRDVYTDLNLVNTYTLRNQGKIRSVALLTISS